MAIAVPSQVRVEVGMPVISFAEALARSETGKRHLLLGNGFSIALFGRSRHGS
jgi:hypothetical protein